MPRGHRKGQEWCHPERPLTTGQPCPAFSPCPDGAALPVASPQPIGESGLRSMLGNGRQPQMVARDNTAVQLALSCACAPEVWLDRGGLLGSLRRRLLASSPRTKRIFCRKISPQNTMYATASDLQKEYSIRFAEMAKYRDAVWKVIIDQFLQHKIGKIRQSLIWVPAGESSSTIFRQVPNTQWT